MDASKNDIIANQVFLGVPWKKARKYEGIVNTLNKKFPLSFVIVGRGDNQDAEDLLQVIKNKIDASSYAIFDATRGNANVSLEFGYAEALDIPRVLYLSTHKATAKGTRESAIIADLAGKRRNNYTNENKLEELLRGFSKGHSYTIKFERFLNIGFKRSSKGEKKRSRALALKIIHELDNQRQVRRADIVQRLQADPASYKNNEIDDMIKMLHKEKLIRSQQGPHSRVHVAYE